MRFLYVLSLTLTCRTEYLESCHPTPDEVGTYLPEKRRSVQDPFCSKFVEEGKALDHNTVVAVKAKNLIDMRTEKYRQWLSMSPNPATYTGTEEVYLRNRFHLRLEAISEAGSRDMARVQEEFIGKPLRDSCVSLKEPFESVAEHFSYANEPQGDGKAFDAKAEKQKLLSLYTKDDLRFVLDQLDMPLEAGLGYDYGYVKELLQ